jgi:hypothetical protein
MKPTDAVILDNFYCTPYRVILRSGSLNYSTGMSGAVETLARFDSATTSKMLAIASGSMYDVTSGGAVGAAAVSGLSNSRWTFTNFATPAGQFLYMTNGLDKPILYDGATYTRVDNASTPAITGVTSTLLKGVIAHKFRLWFIENNSLRAWYLPTSSIGGAAQSFDLSGVFTEGGSLLAMGTWTIDGGTGADDYMVFITTKGQIAVYRGTDPASASTWALSGVYLIGTPIGDRCCIKYMGDLLVISQDGVLPMSQALISTRINNRVALTDKIQALVSADTTTYSSLYGWSLTVFPPENMLLVNVPTSNAGTSKQYAMNTISGAWSSFSSWNASSWEVWNDHLYYGTSDGKVVQAWTGSADNGANINGEALQAFSAFGQESQQKRFTEARPIISFDNSIGIRIGINVDFDRTQPSGTPTFTTTSVSAWDSGLWDTAVWGGDEIIKRDWQAVSAIGYWGAMHIKTASNLSHMSWYSTDIAMEAGAVL